VPPRQQPPCAASISSVAALSALTWKFPALRPCGHLIRQQDTRTGNYVIRKVITAGYCLFSDESSIPTWHLVLVEITAELDYYKFTKLSRQGQINRKRGEKKRNKSFYHYSVTSLRVEFWNTNHPSIGYSCSPTWPSRIAAQTASHMCTAGDIRPYAVTTTVVSDQGIAQCSGLPRSRAVRSLQQLRSNKLRVTPMASMMQFTPIEQFCVRGDELEGELGKPICQRSRCARHRAELVGVCSTVLGLRAPLFV
jgi:hypothetical protein